MTAFVIGDDEWRQMRKVDHLARDLYSALRRRMDFATGIVGDASTGAAAVSWYALREDTELEGRPGVKGGKPSEQQLRRRMTQLEKFGLVESIGNSLRLKFRLLLARTVSHVPKKAEGGSVAPESGGNANAGKESEGYSQGNSKPKAITHLNSGKTLKTSPPTPPSLRAGGAAPQIESPAAAPQTIDNPPDETPPANQGSSHSEQRPQSATVGRKGRLAGEGVAKRSLAWQPHLAWPVDLTDAQRARIARSLEEAPEGLREVVMDEWRGRNEAGALDNPFGWLTWCAKQAATPGWAPTYAPAVCARREMASRVLASQAEADAKLQAVLAKYPTGPLPKGMLAKISRALRSRM